MDCHPKDVLHNLWSQQTANNEGEQYSHEQEQPVFPAYMLCCGLSFIQPGLYL
jgi:hypothetical protein